MKKLFTLTCEGEGIVTLALRGVPFPVVTTDEKLFKEALAMTLSTPEARSRKFIKNVYVLSETIHLDTEKYSGAQS